MSFVDVRRSGPSQNPVSRHNNPHCQSTRRYHPINDSDDDHGCWMVTIRGRHTGYTTPMIPARLCRHRHHHRATSCPRKMHVLLAITFNFYFIFSLYPLEQTLYSSFIKLYIFSTTTCKMNLGKLQFSDGPSSCHFFLFDHFVFVTFHFTTLFFLRSNFHGFPLLLLQGE